MCPCVHAAACCGGRFCSVSLADFVAFCALRHCYVAVRLKTRVRLHPLRVQSAFGPISALLAASAGHHRDSRCLGVFSIPDQATPSVWSDRAAYACTNGHFVTAQRGADRPENLHFVREGCTIRAGRPPRFGDHLVESILRTNASMHFARFAACVRARLGVCKAFCTLICAFRAVVHQAFLVGRMHSRLSRMPPKATRKGRCPRSVFELEGSYCFIALLKPTHPTQVYPSAFGKRGTQGARDTDQRGRPEPDLPAMARPTASSSFRAALSARELKEGKG